VIDEFKPKCYLAPFYGKKHRAVVLGNKFKESDTKEHPSLKIYCPKIKKISGLTIALTDPDAPSRKDPKWSEMCHWIAVIPTDDEDNLEVVMDGGEYEVVECKISSLHGIYRFNSPIPDKPPGPPPKTGYHRYVFLLLEGDNSNLTAPSDRQHWGAHKERHGVRDWAKKEGLEVVGANYFYEKNKKQ